MNKCKKCDVSLSNERIHLGYRTCLDCSETEKYASHTIYPHKTGGYIQPVQKDTADNLKRLDRRSVGGGKRAKGIIADQSWDRWLEQYEKNKNKPVKNVKVYPLLTNNYMTQSKALKIGYDKFNTVGYDRAVSHINSLYTNDKITLSTKSSVVSKLTSLQVLPKAVPGTIATPASCIAFLQNSEPFIPVPITFGKA